MTLPRLAIVLTVIGAYALLSIYAEPVAQVLAGFCVGWTASDASRRIVGRRSA